MLARHAASASPLEGSASKSQYKILLGVMSGTGTFVDVERVNRDLSSQAMAQEAAAAVPEVCMSWAWLDDTGERHRYNAAMCEELERALAEGRTHVEVDAQRVVDLGQMRQVHSFAIAIC